MNIVWYCIKFVLYFHFKLNVALFRDGKQQYRNENTVNFNFIYVMEIDVTQSIDKSENVFNSSNKSDEIIISGGYDGNIGMKNLSDTTDVKDVNKATTHQQQNKKCIKHALRQQAKRRRKNTTIASGNSGTVPRIIVKPLPPQPTATIIDDINPVPTQKTPTMKEVLASIPGFSIKPRKRSNKKLSTAAQLEQTKEGCIDLETPDSILVNTNLRGLLNKHTFATLPPLYQQKLVQLLPSVDRQIITNASDANIRLSTSGLNNEFFARACLDWQERLTEGEFTPENQQKLKTEADKERSRLDPWKLKHFEPIWGDRTLADDNDKNTVTQRPPIKTTIKLRPTTVNNKKPTPLIKRRTVGAITRSCSSFKDECTAENNVKAQIPDLLPISKAHKTHNKVESLFKKSEVKKEVMDSGETSTKEFLEKRPDITIINISDTIINTNQETIISCRDNISINVVAEKRRRSHSSDRELKSPKRKTPSPVQIEIENPPVELEIVSKDDTATEIKPLETDAQSDETNEQQDSDSNTTESSQLDIEETSKNTEDERDSISVTTINTPDDQMEDDNYDTKLSDELESTINKDDLKPLETKMEITEIYSDNVTEESEDTKSVETENYSASTEYDSTEPLTSESQMDDGKIENHMKESHEMKYQSVEMSQEISQETNMESSNTQETNEITESFQILPNTLILQQESIIQTCNKTELCNNTEQVEKLQATVEESDLVISQITENNFERVKNISDEDEANEDRFLDAETYVLESGQISLSASHNNPKNEKDEEIQATLFATTVTRGNSYHIYQIIAS